MIFCQFLLLVFIQGLTPALSWRGSNSLVDELGRYCDDIRDQLWDPRNLEIFSDAERAEIMQQIELTVGWAIEHPKALHWEVAAKKAEMNLVMRINLAHLPPSLGSLIKLTSRVIIPLQKDLYSLEGQKEPDPDDFDDLEGYSVPEATQDDPKKELKGQEENEEDQNEINFENSGIDETHQQLDGNGSEKEVKIPTSSLQDRKKRLTEVIERLQAIANWAFRNKEAPEEDIDEIHKAILKLAAKFEIDVLNFK